MQLVLGQGRRARGPPVLVWLSGVCRLCGTGELELGAGEEEEEHARTGGGPREIRPSMKEKCRGCHRGRRTVGGHGGTPYTLWVQHQIPKIPTLFT